VAVLPLPPAFIPPAINAAVTTVAAASAANKVVPLVVTTVGLKATLPILLVGAAILGTIALVGELAQIWSLFNQPQETPTNWEGPTGENIIPRDVVQGRRDGSGFMSPVVQIPGFINFSAPLVHDDASVQAWFQYEGTAAGGPNTGWILFYEGRRPDGSVTTHCVQNNFGNCLTDGQSNEEGPLIELIGWEYTEDGTLDAPDVFPPVLVGAPVSTPAYLPATAPAPAVAPGAPLPLTQPQPQAPGEVAPPTTATPTAPPATLPRTPAYPQPTPTQQPTPTGQETAPSGELVPLPLPLPTPTSPTAHVINGTQVPANGPAPTLTGIAQELGRLERKSAQMLDPSRAPTGPNIDRLGLLAELLGSLVEAVFFLQQGGQYEISSPCELTEAGDRVPVVVPFSGALSSFGVLSNKMDAVAELLQAHKDLKQPICKQTPAIGEPVTVNFEQVS